MKPLSPVDAISPSFTRLRTLLLPPGFTPGVNAPFRFWFFIKITLIGALTQTSIYSATVGLCIDAMFMAFTFSTFGAAFRHSLSDAPHGLATALAIGAVFASVLALGVWVFLGWLWCRLRFTLFDLVLFRHGRVGLAWSRYGAPAWRFFGLTILATLAFVLLLAVTAGPFLVHFFLLFRHLTPQQINADPTILFANILPLYGIAFLVFFLVAIIDIVMQDFILPPMALENAAVEDSARRFLHLLRHRPGSVTLYFILRLVLQMAFTMAGAMAVFIVLGILGVVGVGLGFAIYHAIAHSGLAGHAFFILYCVVAGFLAAAFYFLSLLCLNGAIAVFRQSYALYFYGSHYPLLGDYLDPPLPTPVPAPQPAPPSQPPPTVSPVPDTSPAG